METLIEKIKAKGWTLDPNRLMELDFFQLRNNNLWELKYLKSVSEWRLTKNGQIVYRGQDAQPNEIISRLDDIQLQVIWQ